MTTDLPSPSEYASLWPLDPEMIFLNHGSFGACPSRILEKQQIYRRMLENQPVRFLIREMEDLFDQSRRKAANFVNANQEDLVFVGNATAAVNTIFRSIRFNPGDEILITNHIYPACRRILEYICDQTGAVIAEASYGFLISSPGLIIEKIIEKVSRKTKMALIDHITSATAIIQPVDQIVKELADRGIDTMIDGAHAMGSIPLDLRRTGAAYYTSNCHKWLCAPKSTALLHVRKDKQKGIIPLLISHAGYNAEPFTERFFWPGTYDPSAAICVGDTIDYLGSLLPGGWPALMKRNHDLCLEARTLICRKLEIDIPCPDSMIGSMATFPLPISAMGDAPDYKSFTPLQDRLFQDFNIEIPVWYWPAPPKMMTRISVQLYNSLEQFDYFGEIAKSQGLFDET